MEFFKAEILTSPPNPLLHGRKAGAFCHVDGIDGLFTRDEARALAEATAQAGGREVYCLAWEFEMELRQHCLALEAEWNVKMKLVPIPREIMESPAVASHPLRVACCNPKNRHERKESERFKRFIYEELTKRDKLNLDIFWLKDESLEDSANLPAPDVIAQEIVEDLQAALAQFAEIATDLKK